MNEAAIRIESTRLEGIEVTHSNTQTHLWIAVHWDSIYTFSGGVGAGIVVRVIHCIRGGLATIHRVLVLVRLTRWRTVAHAV